MAGVALNGVGKRYGGLTVVSAVDLCIAEGEFLVLLGPSGCGKTTTLRMIAGLVEPSEGTIHIGGADVTGLPARKRNIGMVFQDYALFPHMTVAENIGFGLRERRIARSTIATRVDELLELIRLPGFGPRYPQLLSGGQQQRVALARALAAQPSVLLMDEPFGALDLKLREAMQAELARLHRSLGVTTVFVTHDQDEAMRLADRIAIMAKGCVEQVGTPEELYRAPVSLFVASFVGKVNIIAGRVAGAARVILPDGTEAPATLRSQDMVQLVIRPERIRLQPGGPALVEQRLFLGNVVHYEVRTPWNQVILVEQGTAVDSLEPGARVGLTWDGTDAIGFPA